ncbi:hypothetical protein N657DRAFT_693108 [Parathielavia appendiculata]|uniref:C2H2-type domain-containing protein n=1 Tax=Parathielavia appendiculata TaxID=2587402 RepID=A0AAN6Z0J0_9PEZI|nr:hypothetical protein N657DRAFT_693108 [Parathielavia appendiculata]
MDNHSATTPARLATGSGAVSAVHGQNACAEGPKATEAPPPGLPQGGLKGSNDPASRSGKDLAEDIGLERRDTTDSCLSDFSQRRTNTDWSIAASTATELTDAGPSSPDILFADDGPELDTETYASSPRSRSLFLRLMASQKSRVAPHGSPPDSLVPRLRRLEQMPPGKSSLNISSGPTMPSLDPQPVKSSPSGSQEPWNTKTGSEPHADNAEEEVADCDRDSNQPDCSTGGRSQKPHSQAQSAVLEGRLVRGDGTDGDADPGDDDDAPTPGKSFPDENLPEVSEDPAGDPAPQTHPGSASGEASDSYDEEEEPSALASDDGIIYEVCEQVLQQALGVPLHDVALAGAMPAAYESVSHFLDELSHIVLNSSFSKTGIVVNESTGARTGSSHVPIWPAGGVADSASADGYGYGAGSRKRSNGGPDGGDSGEGGEDGTPGGGKRRKVSPTEYQLTSMQFACPFRKRNPVRFNVRDFRTCALQPYPDIPQVKRHVKNFHKQSAVLPFTCQRCRRAMGSQEALDRHVSVPMDQICTPETRPTSADPEDGITSGIEEILNDRKAGTKIDTWQSLWCLLFPGDAGLEIPEADFIPPTELEEVYAEFNTGHHMRQLQQCIQQGLGHGNDVESLLSVFRDHIDSVFDTCRRNTSSGPVTGSRRIPVQPTPGQTISRRSSFVTLHPGRPTSRGHGSVDSSSMCSPVATPNSTAMLGNVEQPPPVTEAQSRSMPRVPRTGGAYPGPTGAEAIGDLMMMPLVSTSSSPNATWSQGGLPVTVPPPTHVHVGFGGQGQTAAAILGEKALHHTAAEPRLLPTDSGMEVSGFLSQAADDFDNISTLPTFDSHDGYGGLEFGRQPVHDLCLRPSPQNHVRGAGHEMQGQACSATDPGMIPIFTFDVSAMDDGFMEAVRRSSVWSDGYNELSR